MTWSRFSKGCRLSPTMARTAWVEVDSHANRHFLLYAGHEHHSLRHARSNKVNKNGVWKLVSVLLPLGDN